MKRVLIPLLVVAAIAAGVWWARRPRPQTLVLTGTVDGNEVVVGSKITGRIVSLTVEDGTYVHAGQVLAVLDQSELRADDRAAADAIAQAEANTQQSQAQTSLLAATLPAKVSEAEAQLAQNQAQWQQAQANVKQAQANWDKANANYTRVAPLVAKGVNPPIDLDNDKADLDAAAAARAAAEAAVEGAQRGVAAAQAAVNDARQQELQIGVQEKQTAVLRAAASSATAQRAAATARFGDTTVVAPVDGVITLRAARQGEVVSPGSPIVTIFDMSDTWIDTDVEETYADLIKMGQTLTARLPSGAETSGPVIYKAVEADFATQRDVSRTKRDIKTVAIRVKVNNPQGELPLGMTAWVVLPVPAVPPPPPPVNTAKQGL